MSVVLIVQRKNGSDLSLTPCFDGLNHLNSAAAEISKQSSSLLLADDSLTFLKFNGDCAKAFKVVADAFPSKQYNLTQTSGKYGLPGASEEAVIITIESRKATAELDRPAAAA